ncbi:MAG: hypothetical protein J3K34DRAFT_409545 [Monoraphidium minutum]|nr:MAG: hypothetical protein J3K34DRAFT_409545 [Monoraphidium minutum]
MMPLCVVVALLQLPLMVRPDREVRPFIAPSAANDSSSAYTQKLVRLHHRATRRPPAAPSSPASTSAGGTRAPGGAPW